MATPRRELRGELLSISPKLSAKENIHKFLKSALDTKTADIREAVFHYRPKTTTNNRFELAIASPQMFAAAWQYGHGKLLLMDCTFGICLQKILLFVKLVIDENYKGVPVALFLVSATLGDKQTSSGFNAATLQQFLSEWKDALGEKEVMPFTPKVWKGKILGEFRMKHILTEADIIPMATKLTYELPRLKTSADVGTTDARRIVEGGINFVRYLFKHWLRIDILSMRIPLCLLPDTNNHTKGFNFLCTRYGLGPVKLNGLRVRADVFVAYCIRVILPTILGRRALEREIVKLQQLRGSGQAPVYLLSQPLLEVWLSGLPTRIRMLHSVFIYKQGALVLQTPPSCESLHCARLPPSTVAPTPSSLATPSPSPNMPHAPIPSSLATSSLPPAPLFQPPTSLLASPASSPDGIMPAKVALALFGAR
ncbi:hypothetical protein BDK51DRAFT_32645 [Blyttiomyces helicus]|uniref:MULE transposase domain-containing protein n=1 Tax=Blyttiomyces helicus TaxID=388810 RepID=A0A4P9W1E5_9FUNG|nr:hypothetical protein BDK51DRAFT_32645 [Blyttiomyces helicus]|eukprot:RKO84973.1 hypothetical protein BDK51DRAFT_32645 [Blyttiomyces helicus]